MDNYNEVAQQFHQQVAKFHNLCDQLEQKRNLQSRVLKSQQEEIHKLRMHSGDAWQLESKLKVLRYEVLLEKTQIAQKRKE